MRPIVSVLEPATSLLLADLETAKDELGIAPEDTSQDARISRYLAQASSQIHRYCDRIFPMQVYRNVFHRDWWRTNLCGPLIAAAWPIVEVIGVSADGSVVDEYLVQADAGLVYRSGYSGFTAADTVLDYRAGYAQIPADIEAAAIRLVRWNQGVRGWDVDSPRDPMLRSREGSTYGRIEWFGNYTPGLEGGLPQEVAQMLDHYCRPVIA